MRWHSDMTEFLRPLPQLGISWTALSYQVLMGNVLELFPDTKLAKVC